MCIFERTKFVLSLNNENLYQQMESIRYIVMDFLGIVGPYYGNI